MARLAKYVTEKKRKTIQGRIEVPFLKSSLMTETRREYGPGIGNPARIKH